MIKKILSDYEKMEKANELFTEALVALEAHRYEECIRICKEVLAVSISIEQRLGIMLVEGLANGGCKETIKAYLDEAYSYDK